MSVVRPYDEIKWGKYKGSYLSKIVEKDPQYLLWSIVNVDFFAIINLFFLIPDIQTKPLYRAAIEINSIKKLTIDYYNEYDIDYYDDGWYDDYYEPDPCDTYDSEDWRSDTFDAFEGDMDILDSYNL